TGGRRPLVRISSGTWTTNFLADNFARLWTSEDPFRIAFKATEAKLDIAHREVEIGIRNAPPESPNLAGRRTVTVAQAPFRARGHSHPGREEGWVAIAPEDMATRPARWRAEPAEGAVVAWANSPRTLQEPVRPGVGGGPLPRCAAHRAPPLEPSGL